MESVNWIYKYYQQIKDGTINANKWIKILYKYIIEGFEKKLFFYDIKKANKAISFIENFAHHHEGILAPQLIKLEIWQKALISIIFGVIDNLGNRQFREIVVVVGRKNGKTLLAAAIAEYMLYLDGEYGPRIYFCAPKLQQANLCYDALVQMIKNEPELESITKKRRTDIYVEQNNGSAMPLAFSAKKSDGLNISFCVADENASWEGISGLKFYEVIKSSMGSRKNPLLLSITTSGYINEGVYDELIKRSTRFLMGDSKEKRLLPVLYMIDDIEKWNDINELQKSMPNLGVSVSVDYMLEEIAIAEGSMSKKTEFLVKYCNIKQNSTQAWLTIQDVENAYGCQFKFEDFSGCYCVGGIDLSQTTDLTACNIAIEKDGEIYVFSQFFLPSEKIEEATERDGLPYKIYIEKGILTPSGDNFIDYNDVYSWYRQVVEKYKILPLKIGYDRYSAQYLIQDMKQYGFHMDDVYQGDNLWPVIQEFEGLLKDKKVHIGENDLMKVHMLDSAIKMNSERGRGRLIKINQMRHIDGMAALLDAMCVRQKWYSEIGNQLKNERKKSG